MKKFTVIILFTSVSFALLGQKKPDWLDTAFRETTFPANVYYTGFAYGNAPQGKSLQEAMQQIKTDAQADLSKKISLKISSQSQTNIAAVSTNGQYNESENFFNQATTKSATEVVGLKTESYYDQATKIIYAFASVKRDDLSEFYKKQINVGLNKAETTIGVSKQLATANKKISARRKIEEAKQILNDVSFYCDLLVAVDVESNDSSLQTGRGRELLHTVEQMLIDLEQSTLVYINCSYEYKSAKDNAFNSDPCIFCDIIAQALSENECSVTGNKEEADYELTLITSTAQRSDGKGEYGILSYYANVKGTLYNRLTKKTTVDFSFLNDPAAYASGKSPEDAATKAFKLPELKNKVLEKILPKIKE